MSLIQPPMGNRTYTLTMLLAVLCTLIWGFSSYFEWDPLPILATLGGLSTVFGVRGMSEWRNRARIAATVPSDEDKAPGEEATQ